MLKQATYRAGDINCRRSGSGPVTLLVHGNPATHTLWRPLAGPLAAQRTVLAVDLPGFGDSPAPEEPGVYRLESLATLLLEAARAQECDTFDLIGHSFGGAVSLTMARLAPERIRSLTLITPLSDAIPPLSRPIYSPIVRSIVRGLWHLAPSRLRRSVIRRGMHISSGAAYSDQRATEVADELDHPEAIDAILGVMASVDYGAYRRTIDDVCRNRTIPLLLVGAGRDRVIPYGQFLHMRELLHPDRVKIFDDGEHLVMWQHRHELLEVIADFLDHPHVHPHGRAVH